MARDVFHGLVRRALEHEGWTITHDPLELSVGKREVFIDLGAEIIGAELNQQKIAVEIKSFLSLSPVTDFHLALGQFLNYQSILSRKQPERVLYLAVPENTFLNFFSTELVQIALEDHVVNLLIYSTETEELLWIPNS